MVTRFVKAEGQALELEGQFLHFPLRRLHGILFLHWDIEAEKTYFKELL